MPLYTLYPCRNDGSSDTFLTLDVTDDAAAYARALHILDQHPTASHVAIWCGERKAGVRQRVDDRQKAVLTRKPRPFLGG